MVDVKNTSYNGIKLSYTLAYASRTIKVQDSRKI